VAGPVEPGTGGPAVSEPVPTLRAVADPADAAETARSAALADPGASTRADGALTGRHGLSLAYAVLGRLVDDHGLARATVVVDDADLGRQLLLDRRHPIGEADVARFDAFVAVAAPGLHLAPPLEPGAVDADLVVALVETALRVAALEGAAPGDAPDLLDIAVRRIAGVHSVHVDADSGVVQVLATTDAPADLARQVVDLATSFLDGAVAVEIIRGNRGDFGAGAIDVALPSYERTELVAVTNAFETQEIEVHVRRGGVRTIGRAPASRGLTGAVEATLEARAEIGECPERDLEWVRTIETTAQHRFLVAVALRDPAGTVAYGLADEGTPIAAAAHATLNAIGT